MEKAAFIKVAKAAVIIGVLGELLGDGGIFNAGARVQEIQDKEISSLTKKAGDAEQLANAAITQANTAQARLAKIAQTESELEKRQSDLLDALTPPQLEYGKFSSDLAGIFPAPIIIEAEPDPNSQLFAADLNAAFRQARWTQRSITNEAMSFKLQRGPSAKIKNWIPASAGMRGTKNHLSPVGRGRAPRERIFVSRHPEVRAIASLEGRRPERRGLHPSRAASRPPQDDEMAKSPNEKNFTKRRSVAEGLKLADAAHAATWRVYCDVFSLWRGCRSKKCRHHRRCLGEPAGCLLRALAFIPPARREEAAKAVITGGPRRIPPATHLEWTVRRERLPRLMMWRMPPTGG